MIELKELERRLEKEGLYAILRRNRQTWSRFNLVEAYKLRVKRHRDASFNDFLCENAVPASAHYAETMGHNVVLWHATRRRHTENIVKRGLFHHRGVFFAHPTYGLPFRLAAGIPAVDRKDPEQLVVLACVFDLKEYESGTDFIPGSSEYRFLSRVSPQAIFAAITHESVECVGPTVRDRDHLSPAKFVRRGRKWAVASQNPQRFTDGRHFRTPPEWLNHYLDIVFSRNRELTLLEIFSGVYACVAPASALPVELVVEELSRRCVLSGKMEDRVLLRSADWEG